ncbi:hypothetical protein [Streptomyces sp. L2]|uniref:hypothetical protein n=1 Tax=Streptomyces sp. L2 TaxID=2162665 RepID=UPI001011002C|nr:hypothetical protein [Streptomyces sp. L2]
MVVQDDPQDYWIALLDIEDFSLRPETTQATLHDGLYEAVEFALARAGIGPEQYTAQDRGDGMLLLLPPETRPTRLLRELVRGLDDALARHRDTYSEDHRMRLRLGLGQGLVLRHGQRWTGTGINDVARLVDAAPVKRALAQAGRAHLVVVVSDAVHRKVVRGRYPGIDAAAYLPADFVTKHGEPCRGWVTMPGYPAPPGLPADSGEPPRARAGSGGPAGAGGTAGAAGGGTEPGSPVPPSAQHGRQAYDAYDAGGSGGDDTGGRPDRGDGARTDGRDAVDAYIGRDRVGQGRVGQDQLSVQGDYAGRDQVTVDGDYAGRDQVTVDGDYAGRDQVTVDGDYAGRDHITIQGDHVDGDQLTVHGDYVGGDRITVHGDYFKDARPEPRPGAPGDRRGTGAGDGRS